MEKTIWRPNIQKGNADAWTRVRNSTEPYQGKFQQKTIKDWESRNLKSI